MKQRSMYFSLNRLAAISSIVIALSIFLSFQNCAKVQFSPKDEPVSAKLTNNDLVDAVAPVTYEPPVTPAGPVHGDIVGTLKPFVVEAQKVVPKTKMVIVVDNSGSMKNSQDNLAKGVDSMLTSLESQIVAGVNPDVEFYVVTTTIPQVGPQSISINSEYLGNGKYLYTPSFYGKDALFDPATQVVQYYNFGYSTLLSYDRVMENNARLSQFNLNYPASTLNLSKKSLTDLVAAGEFLPFAGGCSSCEPITTTYDKFKTYIGYNSSTNSKLNYDSWPVSWAKPSYIYSSTGSPVSYNAKFEFNTNFPTYNSAQQIVGSVPFKKLNLSPEVYLTSVKSSDRVYNPEKFAAFKKDLTDLIKSVSVKGSNKEMGLCVLHRSLTMSGENQIFKKGDRAAFLIISDEQDAMTSWNDCALKSEIAKESPLKFDLVSVCTGGSDCVFPVKASDYSAYYSWQVERTPWNYDSPKIPHVHYTYSQTYNQAGAGQPNYKYFRYLNFNYVSGYAPFVNSEGKVVAQKDGKDGRPLEYSYNSMTVDFNSYATYLSSAYSVHESFTDEQVAAFPRVGSTIQCRPQDLQAVIDGLRGSSVGFKSVYDSASAEQQQVLIKNCNIPGFAQTVVGASATAYNDLPAVSNQQCQVISQEYKAGVKCSEEERLQLENSFCGLSRTYNSAISACSVSSCFHSCSPSEKYMEPAGMSVMFKTSDANFANDFHAGYNKPFEASSAVYDITGLGGIVPSAYKVYNSYEEMMAAFKIPSSATASTTGGSGIYKTANPVSGSRVFSQITTDFSEVTKITDVGAQTKAEGLSIVPVVMDAKTMTTKDFVAKMKEQMITSFHMRAKKLFNNNYFVSSIVIPNDGTYASGMCPGTPLTEEQSPGTAYLQLLDDAYFTNQVSIDGKIVNSVDNNRRAFADICKGDFTPALSPLKDFISNVSKNIYDISIPVGREIHSVVVDHVATVDSKSSSEVLSKADWSYDGKQIEINIDKLEIGDSVTVNLTVPEEAVGVRQPASSTGN